jgi:Flp pilus assembly protein TadG
VAKSRNHRGVSIVYVTVAMLVLLGFCSLSVDLGRVQMVKTQLEEATDAAARAAAGNLANGVSSVQSAAYTMALNNTADGTPVTIDSINDVVFLNWPSTTPLAGSARDAANAVQINTSLSVPLLFAQVLGMSTATVHATSVATVASTNGNYQIVGLSSFTMGKDTITDSYNSANGSYFDQTPGNQGSIASNSNVNVPSGSTVNGNAYEYTDDDGN